MAHELRDVKLEISFAKDDHHKVSLLNDPRCLPNFYPKGQSWQLLRQQARGLIITYALLAVYVGVLRAFEIQQNFDNYQKHIYNSLSAALLIGLGLNFFEVFKDVAKTIRWPVLSKRSFTVREVDLILGLESLIKVGRLGWESVPRKPLISALCAAWLLLNLAAQVAVALLQLNASIEGGHDSNGTVTLPGTVNVTKLECFYREGEQECDDSPTLDPAVGPRKQDRVDPAIAHAYGEAGLNSDPDCVYEQNPQDILGGPQTCPYFRRNDRQQFVVRFADWNPDDSTHAYPSFAAGRWLSVEATNCSACGEDCETKPPDTADGPDGPASEYVWKAPPGSPGPTISVPRVALAAFSTSFVWNGTSLPSHEHAIQDCGPRCARLYAVRDMFRGDAEDYTVARCDVVVSAIANATKPEHDLPDPVATTAGAAVALTGRWRPLNWRELEKAKPAAGPPVQPESEWRQFQLYQEGSPMSVGVDENVTAIGARMAEFAAAALGTLALRNPHTQINDTRPELGYQLAVRWPYVAGLAGGIALAHALFVALMLWLARPVVVPGDSALVLARMLRCVVGGLAPSDKATRLQGEPLANEISAVGTEGKERQGVEGLELRERGRPQSQRSEGFQPLMTERSASPRHASSGRSFRAEGLQEHADRPRSERSLY